MQNPHDANVLQYFDYIVKNITLGSLLASVKQLAQVRNRPQGVVRNEIARGIPSTVDSCQLSAMLFHSTENRLCEIHRKVVRQQFAHFVNHSNR